MTFKSYFAKWQKKIQAIFTVICLILSGIVIYVGYFVFHDRILLFWVFAFYIIVLTGVAIFFGRRLIAMIFDTSP